MSAPIWRAVQELAAVWRSSPYIQQYAAGLWLARACGSRSAGHVEAQPFYLSTYLPTTTGYEEATRSASAQAWLEKSRVLGDGYTVMIEWLRSRLGGYPYPGAPQLAPGSPWTTHNVSMRVPWLLEHHSARLETRATPPTMPFLAADRAIQLDAGAHLGDVIASSSAAAAAEDAWERLTDADHQQLHSATTILREARYVESGDDSGREDFRELAWSETVLDQVLRELDGRARWFADALTDVDRLIQQVAALFGQLTLYEQVRRISAITEVEQFSGSDGWHTVRSTALPEPGIRQFEVIGFDHPYPSGIMLVGGTTETLGYDHHELALHGRMLPGSAELAATAVPAVPLRLRG